MQFNRPSDEQRQHNALVTIYSRTIGTIYDAGLDATAVQFFGCIMNTVREVEVAFEVLQRKLLECIAPFGRRRCGILVDIAALDVAPAIAPIWGKTLRGFLDRNCLRIDADRFVVARYNSRPLVQGGGLGAMEILIMDQAAVYAFQANILNSQVEAVALLRRLYDMARVSGMER
jgi:hypothetical protein